MRILIATGIYPPEIGGIATYAKHLAEGLSGLGHEVTVVTYTIENDERRDGKFCVVGVSKRGTVVSRWLRYASVLKKFGADADRVIALSSVSVGVPLIFAMLQKPKHVLRLGGDFFWERSTDGGGRKSLREWYASWLGFWRIVNMALMEAIFCEFDALAYSTDFQKRLHEKHFPALPPRRVIENARPIGEQIDHHSHTPFTLLFMGRFVGFKNLSTLIAAMKDLPEAELTLVGEGPTEQSLKEQVRALGLEKRVTFRSPARGEEQKKTFAEHDLLILPSVTEISPNVALEASAVCLPVLLTEETGLRSEMFPGILMKPLRTSAEIVTAVRGVISSYPSLRYDERVRDWTAIAREWDGFLKTL